MVLVLTLRLMHDYSLSLSVKRLDPQALEGFVDEVHQQGNFVEEAHLLVTRLEHKGGGEARRADEAAPPADRRRPRRGARPDQAGRDVLAVQGGRAGARSEDNGADHAARRQGHCRRLGERPPRAPGGAARRVRADLAGDRLRAADPHAGRRDRRPFASRHPLPARGGAEAAEAVRRPVGVRRELQLLGSLYAKVGRHYPAEANFVRSLKLARARAQGPRAVVRLPGSAHARVRRAPRRRGSGRRRQQRQPRPRRRSTCSPPPPTAATRAASTAARQRRRRHALAGGGAREGGGVFAAGAASSWRGRRWAPTMRTSPTRTRGLSASSCSRGGSSSRPPTSSARSEIRTKAQRIADGKLFMQEELMELKAKQLHLKTEKSRIANKKLRQAGLATVALNRMSSSQSAERLGAEHGRARRLAGGGERLEERRPRPADPRAQVDLHRAPPLAPLATTATTLAAATTTARCRRGRCRRWPRRTRAPPTLGSTSPRSRGAASRGRRAPSRPTRSAARPRR